MIILLIAVLLVALFSVYLMNKLYSRQSEKMQKENGVQYETPNLGNAQNQVDSAREKIKNIENARNKQLEDAINQK